jgi:hypothetical protein
MTLNLDTFLTVEDICCRLALSVISWIVVFDLLKPRQRISTSILNSWKEFRSKKWSF